ncbi:replication-relaxation family protein [Granulicella sp. L60]|uniref:replication-relaxation family protein n=1 Tax=Granulicella sp. L60 TaxID=1641866 RepID=UPI00131E7EA9|nr:replication-relaxation family protein [Granulicella sp. L60]
MRYRKGCIAISDEQDLPVLLHIRNARALTLNQLYRLLVAEKSATVRRSVQWRVTRLEQSGLVSRMTSSHFFRQPIYRITSLGLSYLEMRGHTLVSLPSTGRHVLHETQLFHALELVEIRLALREGGLLQSWQTELELASRNLVFYGGEAKDYDALATLQTEEGTRQLALEYERTVKGSARYSEIRGVLNEDKTAETILYLTSSHDVSHVLAVEMRGVKKTIGVALSEDFRRDLLITPVMNISAGLTVTSFREFLQHAPHVINTDFRMLMPAV